MSLTMIQLSVSVPFAASATMMLHPGSFSVMTTGQVALAAVLAVTVVAGFGLLNLSLKVKRQLNEILNSSALARTRISS